MQLATAKTTVRPSNNRGRRNRARRRIRAGRETPATCRPGPDSTSSCRAASRRSAKPLAQRKERVQPRGRVAFKRARRAPERTSRTRNRRRSAAQSAAQSRARAHRLALRVHVLSPGDLGAQSAALRDGRPPARLTALANTRDRPSPYRERLCSSSLFASASRPMCAIVLRLKRVRNLGMSRAAARGSRDRRYSAACGCPSAMATAKYCAGPSELRERAAHHRHMAQHHLVVEDCVNFAAPQRLDRFGHRIRISDRRGGKPAADVSLP